MSAEAHTARRRRSDGERSRQAILREAARLATVDGIDGLSLGRLADAVGMSKSGLFAHFGAKEELQLATIEMARQIFVNHVIRPALAEPEGIERLLSLCRGWLGHVEGKVFKGGCFFTAASLEFDSREGPVRDAIADAMKAWLATLARAVEGAKKARHMKSSVNPEQFAFEIYSLAMGANWALQLLDDRSAMKKARENILARFRSAMTPSCPPIRLAK
jgi:AcrR family transcriptional regulator